MPLKKVDSRIRTLVENGVILNHRSLFVIVGDHGRDQVGACISRFFIMSIMLGAKVISGYMCGMYHNGALDVSMVQDLCIGHYVGGTFTSHVVEGCTQSTPVCSVVLQERAGLQQVRVTSAVYYVGTTICHAILVIGRNA